MKAASGQLVTLLGASTGFLMAELYTFTLRDATVYRWTSHGLDLTIGGNTFLSAVANGVPSIRHGAIREVAGLEVDTLEVTIERGDSILFGGIPFPLAMVAGAFDGATLLLERVFMPTWGDVSPGTVVRFVGNVSTVKPSSTRVVLQVKSDLERLNAPMPRDVYTPQCVHAVYDAGCTLSRATFTVTGTATGVPTTTTVPSALAQATGYFALGVITMTSGAAVGQKRAVKTFAGGLLTLTLPFTAAPAAGDTFTVYPGCDKLQATCSGKFSNLTHFTAFPYIPRPETAR